MSRASLLLACATVLGIGAAATMLQEKLEAGKQKSSSYDLTKAKFYGPDSCAGCHSPPAKFPTDFVQLSEYETWFQKDKHSIAYKVLEEDRAQRMGKILNIAPTKSDACLNCHAMNFPEDRQGDQFSIKNGVTCDGCHGPAQHWFGEHTQKSWRLKPGVEKEAMGMVDVRDPVKRTRMCLSCHLGNVEEGKVVTHEMYAAGHPPLPGVDVATFSRILPQHWRDLKDIPFLKSPKLEKLPKGVPDEEALKAKLNDLYHLGSAAFEQTKMETISGLASFQESMLLVANIAEGKAGKLKVSWPELAQFDCYACHHELKTPSWRQERGYSGPPGRPQLRPWPTVLVRLGIRHAAGADGRSFANLSGTFATPLKDLESALNSQPFGAAPAVAAKARKMAALTDDLLKEALAKKFDLASSRSLLYDLVSFKGPVIFDFDSARQISWAFQRISAEASPKLAADMQVAETLKELTKDLKLDLYTGKAPIEKHLPEGLKRLNDYDPHQFGKNLAALKARVEALLPKTKAPVSE
jgi:hypothetical protein